jgi:hypothetical protein
MKHINPKFKTLLKDSSMRFTIILGSGFHRQAIGENSILSNWEKLLNQYNADLKLTGFYPLDYEQLVVQRTGKQENEKSLHKAANAMEKFISEEICFDLSCAQEKALKFSKKKYPKGIFNPKIVSDIISLNFDTTAEVLCSELAKVKEAIYKSSKFDSTKIADFEVPYWEVSFAKNEIIRFWHPHGSIHDKLNLTLGIREYSKRIQTVERLRNYSKSENQKEQISWYRQLTHNPVLILGSEMSKDEWDLWFALANRERNFAKKENQQYNYPIFQMRECECKNDAQHEWFEPLFTGINFDEQWKELEKLFKK